MSWWPFARKNTTVDVGQVSIPEDEISGVIGKLAGFYAFAGAPFPLEFLGVLESLAIFNPDISQALQIWVNLGNTGHELTVEARNPQAALDRLNALAASVYPTGGGVDGLVNHFLRQIPLMGALSAEWVIADNLRDGIADCSIVAVKRIRFQRVNGVMTPFQMTNQVMGGNSGYVQLNPLTYSYMPLQTADGSPYAIPPFYAALKNIEVQLDATASIGPIIRKMGLLGFMDVTMKVPEQKAQESDESYRQRLITRLRDYAKAYTQNISRGVAVHYDDQEIKHNATNAGAAGGAKAIWEMNEEQIFSALDIPPSLAGRSYSTTETYAQVDYDRMQAKLAVGKLMIKRFIEKGYRLDLLLRGIDASVSLQWHSHNSLKAKDEAETEGLKIKNILTKRDGGIISSDEAAQELGYEKATGYHPGDAPAAFSSQQSVRFAFNRATGRYVHVPEVIRLEQPADDRADQNYITSLQAVLDGPEQAAITAALAKAETFLETNVSVERFALEVYTAFAVKLRIEIGKTSIMKVCKHFTGAEWKRWRHEDKNHLKANPSPALPLSREGAKRLEGIDIAVVDKSALNYITNVEQFYFGRGNYLANNETTGKQFVSWLQDEYITKGLNIKDAATWSEFKTKFAGLVNETSVRKIEQIVSTTMSRVQNMGQTMSLYEAGIKRYQIVGPSTYPICAHCKAMLGRIFEVKVAATRLAQILDKGFEKPADLPPFLSSKYTADEVTEMSDAELQAAGFETAPFHPECRHRKAAVD